MFTKRAATALSVLLIACNCLTAVAAGSNPVSSDSVTNTAMGTDALQNNFNSSTDKGYQNTAAGYGAMQGNTSGYKNAAFGYEALPLNTTGWFNTAVGSGSLNQSQTG